MRIALVTEFFYPTLGGIQEHVYFVCRELLRRGHRPTIITPRVVGMGPKSSWWPKDLPAHVHHEIGLGLPYFANGAVARSTVGFRLGRTLAELLRPAHFDLADIQSPGIGNLPILANHFAEIPVCGTLHTSFAKSAAMSLLRPLLRRHYQRLNAVIGVSPVAIESMQRYCEFTAEVIPNGIDTAQFHPVDLTAMDDRIAQLQDGRINIFFIGRADPRNGLDTLIQAFHELHRAVPETRLVIAGDGMDLARCKRIAATLFPEGITEWALELGPPPRGGVSRPVVFLGPVRAARARLYRSCHIQVFNVERATCPITLLEGMSSGLPVLCSDFEGHRFMGTPGQHFMTARFGSVEEVATRLLELVQRPELRARIGEAARQRAMQFDWSRITEKILQVYARMLSESRLDATRG